LPTRDASVVWHGEPLPGAATSCRLRARERHPLRAVFDLVFHDGASLVAEMRGVEMHAHAASEATVPRSEAVAG
jgi:hypothetical protein